MNPLNLIPAPYRLLAKAVLVLLLVAAALAAYHWWAGRQQAIGEARVQARWDADNIRRERATNAQREAHAREGFRRFELHASIEERKNREIAALHHRVAGLLDQLRSRPERPAGSGTAAGNPAPGQACTGAELYRPDAEFLVREAARAQRILAERDACHDKYDALTVKP